MLRLQRARHQKHGAGTLPLLCRDRYYPEVIRIAILSQVFFLPLSPQVSLILTLASQSLRSLKKTVPFGTLGAH